MNKPTFEHQFAPGFSEWRSAVDDRMFEIYAITIDDAGMDHPYLVSQWKMQQSPCEFVDWLGKKFDLTPRSDVE
jgi:hypothetical protein